MIDDTWRCEHHNLSLKEVNQERKEKIKEFKDNIQTRLSIKVKDKSGVMAVMEEPKASSARAQTGCGGHSILIIAVMFISIFIRCPLTWDR